MIPISISLYNLIMSVIKKIAGYPKALLLCLFLMMAVIGRGQTVINLKGALNGAKGQLAKDSSVTVMDSLYFNASKIAVLDTPYKVRNIVTLKIDEYAKVALPSSFTASAVVRIIYTLPDYSLDSIERTLSVNYIDTTSYNSRNSFVFGNAHRVITKIVSVTTTGGDDITKFLLLDNEMQVTPVYKLSCMSDVVKQLHSPALNGAQDLQVGWDPLTGADVYDLEWTFIDSSALKANRYGNPVDANLLFKNNASRVTVAENSYNIPLLYGDTGVVYYRVRAVQERERNVRIETAWSTDFGGLGSYIFFGHQDALNWQSTTTFAEEGKRKSVVQYYDGSQRSRQTVTKDNSTNTTIVGETFYDHQGRAVIQVMPSPTLNSIIKYTPGFNKGINSPEYDKGQYDTLTSPTTFLTASAQPMSTESGANQYYSPNNPDMTGFNKYIPDAEGYAFTETAYTQDNTGRISRQSGVGPVFKLGGQHQTEYYYGSPGDGDLDALFGTDVGDKSHYFKNMVRDANGQYAVSYVDMHGRTIATALAGRPDGGALSDLSSYTEVNITDTLSREGSNVLKDLTLETKQSQLVTIDGDYKFNYHLDAPVIRLNGCKGPICFNGLYDLEIKITDDAYNQRIGGAPLTYVFHNYSMDNIKADCSVEPRDFDTSFTVRLPRGNYEITKQLTVSRQALEYYRDSIFMKQDTCMDLNYFIQQQRNLLANEQCVPTCKSCLDSVGTWEAFWAKYPERIGQPVADTALYRSQAVADFNRALEACDALCTKTTDKDDILQALLMDMSAPSGQYADPNDTLSIYSIFYTKGNQLPAPYTRDNIFYLDASGLPDMVYNDETQTYVKPQQLSPEQFAAKFKPSWANALLPLHPEYYKYLAYLQRKPAYDWAIKMEDIDSYATAAAKGYLNPIGNTAFPFTVVAANVDPLYSRDAGIATRLSEILTTYNADADPSKRLSLWSVAAISIECSGNDPVCTPKYKTPELSFSAITCEGEKDMAWRTFRQLYLSARRNILDLEVDNIGAPAGYNQVSSAQLIADNKSPRFNNASAALSQNGLGYMTSNRNEAALSDSVRVALAESYDDNCNAYVSAWMRQLAPCKYDTTSLSWKELKSRLVQVCKEGSDEDHPLGASSVKPTSSYKYRSFQQVLSEFNRTYRVDTTQGCNAYLITAPAPYDKQPAYADKPSYTPPSACECTQLSTLQQEYTSNKRYSDTSFAQYLNRTRGTSFKQSDLTALINACSMSSSGCKYLSNPITIPTLIQCNVAPPCVSCTEVKAVYNDYLSAYPGLVPSKEELDSSQILRNQLFAGYMNYRLGFGKQAWEYLNFLDTCTGATIADTVACGTQALPPTMYGYEAGVARDVIISDLAPTTDNGYVLVGTTKSNGYDGGWSSRVAVSDSTVAPMVSYPDTTAPAVVKRDTTALIMKVDKNGSLIWSKWFEAGVGNSFTKVKPTRDGGFVMIGSVWGAGHDSTDMLVVKTNNAGKIDWSRRIGFNTRYGETGKDIIQTSDGGYAFIGTYNANLIDSTTDWVVGSLNEQGMGKWIRQMGNANIDEPSSLVEVNDTLVVLGTTFVSHADGTWRDFDVMVAKINKSTGVIMKTWRYDLGSAPQTNNSYTSVLRKTTTGYMFSVTNGSTNQARNSIVSVTSLGDIISARFISSQYDGRFGQWVPFTNSLANGTMAIQTADASSTAARIIFNKIFADSTLTWAYSVTRSDRTTFNSLFEAGDGSYSGVGSYGRYGLYLLTPITGRLKCGPVDVPTSFNTYRSPAGDKNGTFSLNLVRNVDSAVLPILVRDSVAPVTTVMITCGTEYACVKVRKGPLLCSNATPIFRDVIDTTNNCSDNEYFAVSKGTDLYNAYRDSVKNSFGNTYADSCIQAGQREVYTLNYNLSEYHYTLYYYDQAGNLVKTVPPAGVVVDRSPVWLGRVRAARAARESLPVAHKMVTEYRYNTLDGVVTQHMPDAGDNRFWYDRLGRLAISQNAKQQPDAKYIYTQYDGLGRITEVGEISSSASMTDLLSRKESSLRTWFANADASRKQITRIVYDIALEPLSSEMLHAGNLRNRIAWTALYDTAPEQENGEYAMASFYSYDIHGNVDTLLQDYKKGILSPTPNRWKKVVYKYDLISGKAHHVAYQPGKSDAVYHRYTYDAENRLTNVETSTDSVYWENDAFYQYYKHGLLAKTVLGEKQVQGIDNAYTLQGWLKGMNSTAVTSDFDMGHDGNTVAKDVYGFALHYYGDSEYKPIGGSKPFADVNNAAIKALYNGNVTAISQSLPSLGASLQYSYNYDVLSRLKGMTAYQGLDATTNIWSPVELPDFKETISYDGNGNILTYNRKGNNTLLNKPLEMDNLTYKYLEGTNKLAYIDDSVDPANYDVDIDKQQPGNYTYDKIGNLIADNAAEVKNIEWTAYGKIASITKSDNSVISYTYDFTGNRISKYANGVYTWYVRDATGSVMAVYTQGDSRINNGHITKIESHLYGSARLGVNTAEVNTEDNPAVVTEPILGLSSGFYTNFNRGQKHFELVNHLGNVLATVSDEKRLLSGAYEADVLSAQDYYPFGMGMPGRGMSSGNYRYGFNGKENDNEVKGEGNQQDYGMRVYDSRIGKFLSVDPLTKSYPELTPYQFASNMPIMGIDLDGEELKVSIGSVSKKGTEIKVTGEVYLKYKVLNLSKSVYTIERFNMDRSILEERYSRMLGGQGSYDYGVFYPKGNPAKGEFNKVMYHISGDMKFNFSMELIDNINQVNKGDYVLLIVDQLNPQQKDDEAGHADHSGTVAAVEAGGFIENGAMMYKMTVLHEIGHNLSLAHSKDVTNFMYGEVDKKALQSSDEQRGGFLDGVGIKNDVKVGKYQYNKELDTRLRILEFLKENNVKISRPEAVKLKDNGAKKPTVNINIMKQ